MLFACVFPNFAAADTELSSVDAEKPEAFFARSAGDGRHNFDHPDYADGQLLSTEREMQISDGIRAAACFAGDVNEDGAIWRTHCSSCAAQWNSAESFPSGLRMRTETEA